MVSLIFLLNGLGKSFMAAIMGYLSFITSILMVSLSKSLLMKNLTGKKDLGEFCDQFTYDSKIQYPARQKHRKIKQYHKLYKKIKQHKTMSTKQLYTKKSKPKTYSKTTDKRCYKCGKISQYAKKCQTKQKFKTQ
ncbi:hypothetical protein ACSBR2_004694 [Camellia fascicularis]